jgi:hypothetical protein
MQSVLRNLHALDSSYVDLNTNLFAQYLTGVQAPMTVDDLDRQREADRRLQERLQNESFGGGDAGLKRSFGADDDEATEHTPHKFPHTHQAPV